MEKNRQLVTVMSEMVLVVNFFRELIEKCLGCRQEIPLGRMNGLDQVV